MIAQLIEKYDYQLKLVIDQAGEIAEVEEFLSHFSGIQTDRVLLMPQGTTVEELQARSEWLEAICKVRGWTFCPRKQIEWFGPVRGT